MALPRQIWALTVKNLLLILIRPWFSTPFRAFFLPVIFVGFLSYARNLFIPPSKFGIAEPTPVRSFSEALGAISGGRDKVAFVNSGFGGGDIDRVISLVAAPAREAGKRVEILSSSDQLRDTCRSSLRGVSSCVVAAEFFSSPTEGSEGRWNYSIRADAALGYKIVTTRSDNDVELYILPFQHAIDWAIASVSGPSNLLPNKVMEYPYTSKTVKEREQTIRIRYMGGIINVLAVAFFIGMVGVTYQLTGLVAAERELGISQLIDCMMPNAARWQPQAARFVSAHLALDAVYAPGWIIMAIFLKVGVFARTSVLLLIVFHILAGLSLSSFSLFGASFFKKAQLSGISVVIICLLLGVACQVVGAKSSNGGVAALSLLFPPMNYVYFTILMARWERKNLPTSLAKAAPESPWAIPGIVFWIFFIAQIAAYPILAAWVERILYGTGSQDRTITRSSASPSPVVSLQGFSKTYKPNWFYRNVAPIFGSQRETVLAVNDLSLSVTKGEIMILLGANGSGKSTTLDAIAGLSKITSGTIHINYPEGSGGFGLCPQRNVLWDQLTVREHVKIFNQLKASKTVDTTQQIIELIKACDLDRKLNSRSRTLSGGQKRKLQLALMFAGGSSICCVDEVSSGLDPISRRKVWDILLAERGERTILLTTQLLDEADILADNIAILSKGVLKAQGTSAELKHTLGSGYRIHVDHVPESEKTLNPQFEDISSEVGCDGIIYHVPDVSQATNFVIELEEAGIMEYRVSGPTIEDVFLKVAEELNPPSPEPPSNGNGDGEAKDGNSTPQLLTGRRIGMPLQAWILFCKRATILRRNYLPYLAAIAVPVIAAGLVTLFLRSYRRPGCSGADSVTTLDIASFASQINFDLVLGPSNKIPISSLSKFSGSLPKWATSEANVTKLVDRLHIVDTLQEFNDYISNHFHNVTPGGFFLGDKSSPPTFAWRGNGDISFSTIIQNAMDNLLTNITIGSQYQSFDVQWAPDVGKALQLITYFGLAMSVYPAFFSLYPTVERLRNVRALHYSNGARSLSLWLAYLSFDFLTVLAVSVLATVIFRAASGVWYNLGCLFVVFCLYGVASSLLAYVISIFSKSQLAAFAFSAGGQAVMFLLYFIAYMSVLTYAPTDRVDSIVKIVHFSIATISPVSNLTRAMFVSLNIFSILCRDREVASYAGEMALYGGPILYLVAQSLLLFGLLLWWDSAPLVGKLREKFRLEDDEQAEVDEDIANELVRVSSSNDGLRVLHLTKAFGKFVAVQDVTFGVARGEVFALLGPNGAGKSTIISLIRGDIQPSGTGGQIFVENIPVSKRRASARSLLGVCPQFDAMDQMTVLEHLRFYARIRGVSGVEHNAREVIRAVGLTSDGNTMAAKLSGGNKRKLSLGIALMGNPTVLLLDEPSSGMDAAAKRVMWRTLTSVVPGRSLVLTTHSMEEADALANRAGIMAKKMLALGSTEYLRRKYGKGYHVHVVHREAPRTPEEDMERIRTWVLHNLPGAVVEPKTYHGQLRFSVPASSSISPRYSTAASTLTPDDEAADRVVRLLRPESAATESAATASPSVGINSRAGERISISTLFSLLDRDRQDLGFEYYSVSQTTMDEVFLAIVGKYNVEEEGERDQR